MKIRIGSKEFNLSGYSISQENDRPIVSFEDIETDYNTIRPLIKDNQTYVIIEDSGIKDLTNNCVLFKCFTNVTNSKLSLVMENYSNYELLEMAYNDLLEV